MNDAPDRPSDGQVLAGAVAAAGAAAGIAIGLGRRGTQPPPVDVARSTVTLPPGVAATASAVGQRAEVLAIQVKERAGTAAKAAPERARAASLRARQEGARLAEVVPGEIERAEAAITTEARRLGRRAQRAARQGSEKGRDVAAAKVDRTKRRARRLGEETTSTTQQLAAQAAAAAVAQAQQLLGAGVSIAGAARGRLPEAPRRGQRPRADVTPAVRDIAAQAASLALDLWHATRERALEAAGSAEVGLGRSTEKASQAMAAQGGRVRAASEAAAERAAERAAEVGGKAAEARSRARTAGRRTAVTTVATGKDTGAALFWTAAAAGLVFYALLDPAKRGQTAQAARAATTQLRELIRDFQGYDDEF